MQIMHIFHKLTFSTSKMVEGAKDDVQWCKGTAFILSGYSFQGKESSLTWIVQWNLLTFPCDVCIRHASLFMTSKERYNLCIIYAWIVHHWIVYHELAQLCLRYTNADLKISLHVCLDIKTTPWTFRILNPEDSGVT